MNTADLEKYISSSTYSISPDTYSIIKSTVMYADAFAMIKLSDQNITLVVKEKEATYHIPSKEIISVDHNWKLITIEAQLPLDLIGFLATISQALADADISIFAISSFDTDHILVKQSDIKKAAQILDDLGFQSQ